MEQKQTPILSKDGIDYYRVVPGQTSPQLAEAIASVVCGALLDEPLCRLLGITLDTIKLFINAYLYECIDSGLSTYATFAGQSTPVGAFICRDYKLPTPEAVKVCLKRGMAPILDVCTSRKFPQADVGPPPDPSWLLTLRSFMLQCALLTNCMRKGYPNLAVSLSRWARASTCS